MLLRQIEYFQAVVEENNFYKAAEKCSISQSAISQQIKKLEEELGVPLLERHNRTFSLTACGEYFYQKSLALTDDLKSYIQETKRIYANDFFEMKVGCYRGYSGEELKKAILLFSEKYPKTKIKICIASHEELYQAMEERTIDLALNDQRRAFSSNYHNILLTKSKTYIEVSLQNPISKFSEIEISDLKNYPCIVIADENTKEEETQYLHSILGIQSNFILAHSIEEARYKLITENGYLLVDVLKENPFQDALVKRVLLKQNNATILKNYCIFWKKKATCAYIEEFARILTEEFKKNL